MQMQRPAFAVPTFRQMSTSAAAAAVAGTAMVPMQAGAEATNAAVSAGGQQLIMELGVYLAQTVIAWGVPAAVVGFLVIKIISSANKGPKGDPLEEPSQGAGFPFFAQSAPGEPLEYLKIERLNDKLESFRYSLLKADQGKRAALTEKKRRDFERTYGIQTAHLTDKQVSDLAAADTKFREADERSVEAIDAVTRELRAYAAQQGPRLARTSASKDREEAEQDEEEDGGMSSWMSSMSGSGRKAKAMEKRLSEALTSRVKNELRYVASVSAILDKPARQKLEKLLTSRRSPSWPEGSSVLSLVPPQGRASAPVAGAEKKHVFVLDFPGDVTASQVAMLREEVTALLRWSNVTRGDEVVLRLNSGGGTVTGYGLAAAQLMRIKEVGLKLNVCVEQVAASGGYMMACCADNLYASPFAVLGSIGVVSEQPNVYERLKREGVEFQTVTAGTYKRTLTPFKKPTAEDLKKSKDDIEKVFLLFRTWVSTQRPILDIDKVATGEIWYGEDALGLKLADELVTSDEVLLRFIDQEAELFSIRYSDPKNSMASRLLPGASLSSNGLMGFLGAAVYQWLGAQLAGQGGGPATGNLANLDALAGMGVDSPEEREQRRAMAVDRRTDYY